MSHLVGHYRKFNNKYYQAWNSFKRKKDAQAFAASLRSYDTYATITKERDPLGGHEWYVWVR